MPVVNPQLGEIQPAISSAEEEQVVILPFEKNGEFYVEPLGELEAKPVYSFVKRAFDMAASLCGLIVLFIPMVIIGILVKCTSEGSAFYAQERLGKDGRPFFVLKFRSMRVDAEKNGAQWAGGDADDRITPLGRFLRKTRLDELPQLLNILKGEMSLVGPRPERKVFYDAFETYVHGFSERLKVKPGLTGLAQVSGGYELRPEEKIVFDMKYIQSRSLGLDFKILMQTVMIVLTHRGAK